MGVSADFLHLGQQIATTHDRTTTYASVKYEQNLWKPDPIKDHPLMTNIRDSITRYHLQSAAHFTIVIYVKQAFPAQEKELTRNTRLNIDLGDWEKQESYVCRPVFRKHLRKKIHLPTRKVEVYNKESGDFIALSKFLMTAFPCFAGPVHNDHMQAWWSANGKAFNWAELPTELKEQVVQCCIYQALGEGDYKQRLSRWQDRCRPRDGRREFGIYEVVDTLTDWAALLGVSHQVRAITLRLCFTGKGGMAYHGGFTILASTCHSLDSALNRLGRYYQMTNANCLPVDYATQALADYYRQYPRIYPQLGQYATFRHGLRNIYLCMDFIAYMHFFKVTLGSFKSHLRPGSISYEVFEQLPNLGHIALRLPLKPQQGWLDQPGQPSPQLFYKDFPCPRKLHRVIYERIAEVLTLYHRVKVTGFVDTDEKIRYTSLRATAMHNRNWSPAELHELYTDCGGGIQLEAPVQPGSWHLDIEEERQVGSSTADATNNEELEDPFFPPKCRCVEQCFLLFQEKEKKRRNYRVPGGLYGMALEDS